MSVEQEKRERERDFYAKHRLSNSGIDHRRDGAVFPGYPAL